MYFLLAMLHSGLLKYISVFSFVVFIVAGPSPSIEIAVGSLQPEKKRYSQIFFTLACKLCFIFWKSGLVGEANGADHGALFLHVSFE